MVLCRIGSVHSVPKIARSRKYLNPIPSHETNCKTPVIPKKGRHPSHPLRLGFESLVPGLYLQVWNSVAPVAITATSETKKCKIFHQKERKTREALCRNCQYYVPWLAADTIHLQNPDEILKLPVG